MDIGQRQQEVLDRHVLVAQFGPFVVGPARSRHAAPATAADRRRRTLAAACPARPRCDCADDSGATPSFWTTGRNALPSCPSIAATRWAGTTSGLFRRRASSVEAWKRLLHLQRPPIRIQRHLHPPVRNLMVSVSTFGPCPRARPRARQLALAARELGDGGTPWLATGAPAQSPVPSPPSLRCSWWRSTSEIARKEILHRRLFGGAFGYGFIGVDVFFVISGFIIFTVHRRDIGHPARGRPYLAKRVMRGLPDLLDSSTAIAATDLPSPATGWPPNATRSSW